MMSDFFWVIFDPPSPLNPIFTFYNPKILDPSPPLKSDIIYERSLMYFYQLALQIRKLKAALEKAAVQYHQIDTHYILKFGFYFYWVFS